ncbi:MAG: hypothetical protein EBR60_10465 [Burkholderiaceae bacterium]|nr:hypothetical protein [Burkholderiaceae bacterium]
MGSSSNLQTTGLIIPSVRSYFQRSTVSDFAGLDFEENGIEMLRQTSFVPRGSLISLEKIENSPDFNEPNLSEPVARIAPILRIEAL